MKLKRYRSICKVIELEIQALNVEVNLVLQLHLAGILIKLYHKGLY